MSFTRMRNIADRQRHNSIRDGIAGLVLAVAFAVQIAVVGGLGGSAQAASHAPRDVAAEVGHGASCTPASIAAAC